MGLRHPVAVIWMGQIKCKALLNHCCNILQHAATHYTMLQQAAITTPHCNIRCDYYTTLQQTPRILHHTATRLEIHLEFDLGYCIVASYYLIMFSHLYTHIYMHIYTYMYIHIPTYICIYICICIYIYMYIYTYIYVYEYV